VACGRYNEGEDDRGVVVVDPPVIGLGRCRTTSTFKTTTATARMAAKGLTGKKNGKTK
jgi:hypothetical protein